jgi:hypothetical protein
VYQTAIGLYDFQLTAADTNKKRALLPAWAKQKGASETNETMIQSSSTITRSTTMSGPVLR